MGGRSVVELGQSVRTVDWGGATGGQGATLLLGGHRLPGPGNWYAPTVFSNVNHSMELMREESFGPIIGIQKVSDDDEAVTLMNDSRYGLTAGVYTPDEAKAFAAQVRGVMAIPPHST